MIKEDIKDMNLDDDLHDENPRRKDHQSHKRGPKTFRRGRAIAFLEMMKLRRSTIMQQLDAPEFQSIHPILVGELKAIDLVIVEFSQLFEIHENETMDVPISDTALIKIDNDVHPK
jgi:hypothetical protein